MPVCMSLMLGMLMLTLALAQQQQVLHGIGQIAERGAMIREGAEALMVDLTDVMEGCEDGGLVGLHAGIPGPGGVIARFHARSDIDETLLIEGEFNGGDILSSQYQAVPGPSGYNPSEGYEPQKTASGYQPRIPQRHAQVYVRAAAPAPVYGSIFSGNFPYGILAPSGNISLFDVRATGGWQGGDELETGRPVAMSASGKVTVSNVMNGRVRGATSVSLKYGGVTTPGAPIPLPGDFDALLVGARGEMVKNLDNKGLLLAQLRDCLHKNIPTTDLITGTCPEGTPLHQINPGSSDVSTLVVPNGTDVSDNLLKVGKGFVVPPGEAIEIPMSMYVAGDLVMREKTVLRVGGSLTVLGHLYMDAQSSVFVDGSLTVSNTVDTLVEPDTTTAISSVITAGGDVHLQAGMSHTKEITFQDEGAMQARQCPFSASVLTCFIPGNPPQIVSHELPNPNCEIFEQMGAECAQALPPALARYFPAVLASGEEIENVAGVMVVADGTMTVQGRKAVGLLVAGKGLTMTTPLFVGAAWVRSGSVAADNTAFRFYEYATHAFVHTAAEDFHVSATRWHRTAYWTQPR